MTVAVKNQQVRIRGTVQGVGFRPTVYRLARECRLNGEVYNDTEGVLVRLSGSEPNINCFLHRLQTEAPPLARIEAIETTVVEDNWHYQNFTISQSGYGTGRTDVSADAASCSACLTEVCNPDERRYLYPFTNCTHCGPRLSIVENIPYDRSHTTMADFTLCKDCRREYSNPRDRRFHAQPIACHRCGPKLSIHGDLNNTAPYSGTADQFSFFQLQQIYQALNAGKILALKGLGGFHLCCDAGNHEAVTELRRRKHRYAKPFALMCRDLSGIEQYCYVCELEKATLTSAAAPIVLLQRKAHPSAGAMPLSDAIAPGSHLLGFMLPYTPLHYLICQQINSALVMTSGNLSAEPQITDNEEAIEKLSDIADSIVYHNRDIANRIDDSVVRCVSGKARLIRRARGYAPQSIALPQGFEQADSILAVGAELKSTFCLIKQGTAIVSQHQGDLENLATFDDYKKNLALYKTLFEFNPQHIAFDQHPEYLSSKLADYTIQQQQLNAVAVQHHHAHITSAMVDNQLPLTHPPVLGVALDGLGYGDDNTFWGGEFLLADYRGYQRVAQFKPTALPGGTQAIKQPWRNTYAHIVNTMDWEQFCNQYADTELSNFLKRMPVATLQQMLAKQLNCPLASSVGRLFDAVAGALNLHAEQVQFEGQAAIALEMLADTNAILTHTVQPYPLTIQTSNSVNTQSGTPMLQINTNTLWPALLRDLQQGESKSLISTRFHAGLIDTITHLIDQLSQMFNFNSVALSGGCMQNAILLQGLEQALKKRQLRCLTHATVPANDGGISLGQAAIAAAKIIDSKNG